MVRCFLKTFCILFEQDFIPNNCMKTKFFHILFIVILCLTTLEKVLAQDSCDSSKSQTQTVISSNNSSDSSDCADCNCHCHHSHFDFAFFTKAFGVNLLAVKNFSAHLASAIPLQIDSLKKPPKIVS
jgi:hypothetical protein